MSLSLAQLQRLPGSEIVLPGITDLEGGRETIDAASVKVAARRLRAAGLAVPPGKAGSDGPGVWLYLKLVEAGIADPYSRYNAILRRIDSFARALEGARAR